MHPAELDNKSPAGKGIFMIKDSNDLKFVPRVCPLCEGESSYTPVGRGYDYDYRTTDHIFEYRRCHRCQVVFPDYEPAAGYLEKLYKESFWHDRSQSAYNTALLRQLRFRNGRLIARLRSIAKKKPDFAMLDIGSGRGDIFLVLRHEFPRAHFHSVDLAFKVAIQGIEHFRGSFEEVDFQGRTFDVITSQHNIEHVYNPLNYLRKAASLLNKDGVIFIATPNVDALEFHIFQKKLYCAGYSIPRHLTLFNAAAFQILVNGVKELKIEQLDYFFTIHHWVGLLHHLVYDLVKKDTVDKWINYNMLPISVPLYLFEFLRYKLGNKTGVLEVSIIKK